MGRTQQELTPNGMQKMFKTFVLATTQACGTGLVCPQHIVPNPGFWGGGSCLLRNLETGRDLLCPFAPAIPICHLELFGRSLQEKPGKVPQKMFKCLVSHWKCQQGGEDCRTVGWLLRRGCMGFSSAIFGVWGAWLCIFAPAILAFRFGAGGLHHHESPWNYGPKMFKVSG